MTEVRALVIDEANDNLSISRLLEADGDIAAVVARRMSDAVIEVSKHRPDVVVLVAPSEAIALRAINEVMSRQPVPILLLAEQTVSREKALGAGAIDVMSRTRLDGEREAAIRRRVRSLSTLKLGNTGPRPPRSSVRGLAVVGIAASTGGPQALATVLAGLGHLPAAILVVQHIHSDFIAGFQAWMDRECPIPVGFASDGEVLRRGRVYIAPADIHLRVAAGHHVVLDSQPVTLHRPSADVLFRSIAEQAASNGIGVLLTGMGEDGVQGLLAIRRANGRTIVQDQQSSAVYGMPGAATQAGAAELVLPLDRIAPAIVDAVAARS